MTREEAIQKIRTMSLPKETMEILEALAPEIAENDDERTRKAIIGLIEELQRSEKYFAGVELTDMIAYLEKQKETSINWMKSDNVKNPDKPYIIWLHKYIVPLNNIERLKRRADRSVFLNSSM